MSNQYILISSDLHSFSNFCYYKDNIFKAHLQFSGHARWNFAYAL